VRAAEVVPSRDGAHGEARLVRSQTGTREKRGALQRFRQVSELFLPCR
jgi:hypothetical protein